MILSAVFEESGEGNTDQNETKEYHQRYPGPGQAI